MHKRTFLLGIGIGIIIGALLLELFALGEKGQKQLTEIEQQLNEGVSPTPAASKEPVVSPSDASLDAEPKSPITPSQPDAEVPETPSSPDSPENNEQVETSPTQAASNATKESDLKDAHIIRIYYGDTITSTAKRLVDQQVIQDADEFVEYFKSHDATIRAGFFLVENETSLKDLFDLFASQPLTESEAKKLIDVQGTPLIR